MSLLSSPALPPYTSCLILLSFPHPHHFPGGEVVASFLARLSFLDSHISHAVYAVPTSVLLLPIPRISFPRSPSLLFFLKHRSPLPLFLSDLGERGLGGGPCPAEQRWSNEENRGSDSVKSARESKRERGWGGGRRRGGGQQGRAGGGGDLDEFSNRILRHLWDNETRLGEGEEKREKGGGEERRGEERGTQDRRTGGNKRR
eukprot:765841-Hanusia_phi.AAC.1